MQDPILIIIIGILVLICLALLLVIILRKKPQDKTDEIKNFLKDENNNLKLEVLKLLNDSNNSNNTEMFKSLNTQFEFITNNVNNKITESFKKTDQTFVNVVERLAKIDEQNKNINKLSTEVLSLNNILTDKLTRGTFGEVQLYKILESTLGNNKSLFETQKKLSNNKIPDALVYAPKPLGKIAIDSKFPLENYQRYIDSTITKEEKDKYYKLFKSDLKEKIKDISEKYIIENETANQAIMFIPAEAIYLEVIQNHFEIINLAYESNVWITSPTTLIASLTVIEAVSNSVRQNEQTTLLVEELKYLANEFRKFKERSDNIVRRVEGLSKDINELNITNNYIYNKFLEIEKGKLD